MGNRGKELTKNTIIVSLGKICTQGISFLLLPLYTSKLTAEQYGIVDLLNTYIMLLVPIIIFAIEQAIFRYLIDARKQENEKKVLISSTFFVTIIQSVIFLFIYIIIGNWIKNEYKYFLATNVVATIFSSITLQIARGLGDNKTYSIGNFLTASINIVFNVVFILILNLGAYGMLIASLIANIIGVIYTIIKLKLPRYIKFKYCNMKKIKEMWKYSVPLIPNTISWWIMGVSDRTIITAILGIGMNGIYSAANKFSSVFTTLYNIFSITWTESVSLHIEDEDATQYITKKINQIFKIFASICLGIIACIPFVFNLLVNQNFSEAYTQIPILMLGALCNSMVILLSAIYIAKKMTKQITKTSFISAIINIILNIVLIKYIGLYAASISTFIAYFAMMMFRMINIKKYMDIKFDKKMLFSISIMSITLLIIYYSNIVILNVIGLIGIILYSIIGNKEIVINLKTMFLDYKNKIIMRKEKDE